MCYVCDRRRREQRLLRIWETIKLATVIIVIFVVVIGWPFVLQSFS